VEISGGLSRSYDVTKKTSEDEFRQRDITCTVSATVEIDSKWRDATICISSDDDSLVDSNLFSNAAFRDLLSACVSVQSSRKDNVASTALSLVPNDDKFNTLSESNNKENKVVQYFDDQLNMNINNIQLLNKQDCDITWEDNMVDENDISSILSVAVHNADEFTTKPTITETFLVQSRLETRHINPSPSEQSNTPNTVALNQHECAIEQFVAEKQRVPILTLVHSCESVPPTQTLDVDQSAPSTSTQSDVRNPVGFLRENNTGVAESDNDSIWELESGSELSGKEFSGYSSDVSETNDNISGLTPTEPTGSNELIQLSSNTDRDDDCVQFSHLTVTLDEKVYSSSVSQERTGFDSTSQLPLDGKRQIRKTPCAFCGKVILNVSIYDHFSTCDRRTAYYRKLTGEDMKSAIKEQGAELRANESGLIELMETMRDDDVKNVVLTDNLIRRYAGLQMDALRKKDDRKLTELGEVSTKVRLLGRLLIAAREKMPNISLDELTLPDKFDLLISSARVITKPFYTVSRKLGFALRDIARTKQGQGLRENDENAATTAKHFLLLLDGEWSFRLNSLTGKKWRAWKRTRPKTIPLTEDLVKLRNYVLNEMKKAFEQLRVTKDVDDWVTLAKLTIVRLLTFNKRRTAEVTSLKVVEYLKRPKWHKDVRGELAHVLTPQEQSVAQR